MTTLDSQSIGTGEIVSRHDIDISFAALRASVDDPSAGLFGPDSMIWRMAAPLPVLPLTLAEAGLLEAPHAIIAFGTLGSDSAADFMPRFHRSIDAFYDWFYGDVDTAIQTARRIFGYHTRVNGVLPEDIGGYRKGREYSANEQDVLIWVWATIVHPLKAHYEQLCGALTAAQRQRYYDECRKFALLFGIDQSRLPDDWSEFAAFFDRFASSPTIEISSEFLHRTGPLSGEQIGGRRGRAATTAFNAVMSYRLPRKVAIQYPHISDGRFKRLLGRALLLAVQVIWNALPDGLQNTPRRRRALSRAGVDVQPSFLAGGLTDRLPAPYGKSYKEAGVSTHGHPLRATQPA